MSEINQRHVVMVKERIQAGDTFLFKINCQFCGSENLMTYPMIKMTCCDMDISDFELVIKRARLLCGTKRPGKVSKKIVHELLNIQGLWCAYCGCSLSDINYHVEHIIPISAGGNSRIDNLTLSCPPCNLTAGSMVFVNFEAKKRYILRKRKI